MKNPFLDSQYAVMMNPFNCLGDFLVKLGETDQFSMNVKDYKTDKFSMANQVSSNKWGLTPEGMVGLDNLTAMERVAGFANLKNNLKIIYKHEKKAISARQPTSYLLTNLLYNGFVSVQRTLVIPVLNHIRTVPVAITSITFDLTPYTNLLSLLGIYEQYFKKSRAVKNFSQYLKLDTYFHTPLNKGELSTLLAMTLDHRAQQVSNLIEISPKTVRFYIYLLRDKLKPDVDLYTVLSHLREHQQWHPDQEIF